MKKWHVCKGSEAYEVSETPVSHTLYNERLQMRHQCLTPSWQNQILESSNLTKNWKLSGRSETPVYHQQFFVIERVRHRWLTYFPVELWWQIVQKQLLSRKQTCIDQKFFTKIYFWKVVKNILDFRKIPFPTNLIHHRICLELDFQSRTKIANPRVPK